MREVAEAIGARLGLHGPTIGLSREEGVQRIGAEASEFAFGSNSRVSAKLARNLGWRPRYNDLLDGIRTGRYPIQSPSSQP